jgi:hypothetical protein
MKNRPLELIYFPDTTCLHFASEDIQSMIIKAMDISKIIHFSTMELETEEFIPGDDLLCMADTFYDLIQEEEDSSRYPVFCAEFSNKITLVGDLNLTFIYAPDTDLLFEFSTFIFNAFGLNKTDCKNTVLNCPNEIMSLTKENGKLNHRIITFYDYAD